MRKEVPKIYINLIQNMYEGSINSIESLCGVTEDFNVGVGVDQESAISSYLLLVVIDEVTKVIQSDILWCMMFADAKSK
jgi:hypothetical protein